MQKISSIEFLRFFSSLMILVWHYQQFYLPYNFFSETEIFFNDKTIQPFFKYIKLLYTHGNYGVDFFFIISGYVFAHVYLIKKKITSGKEFFINRFARLYPLHLLTLLIVLFLQIYSQNFFNTSLVHTNNDLYHFILNFFFISGWGLEKGPSFNGPIWSVSLEIIIYFFFFFLLIKSKNFMLLKSIIIVFLLVLLRKTTNSNFLSNQISLNINIFNCGILFFTGVIVHFLNKKITNRKVFITFGLILLIFSLIGNFKILIFLPSVIIIFLNFENLINKKIRSLFNFLGNLTYGMYLWHLPLQIILMLLIKSNNLSFDLINSKFFFICYLALVFSVSIISYYYFEKKFRERLRFKY